MAIMAILRGDNGDYSWALFENSVKNAQFYNKVSLLLQYILAHSHYSSGKTVFNSTSALEVYKQFSKELNTLAPSADSMGPIIELQKKQIINQYVYVE